MRKNHLFTGNFDGLQKYKEQVFYKKAALKNLVIFTGKYLSWSLFFNKNAGLQSCNFLKKRLQHRCFPMNVAKFVRIPVLKNISGGLFERFPTSTNNITSIIGSEQDILWKTKQKTLFKTQLAFSWCSWSFFSLKFSTVCQAAFALYNKRWQWWRALNSLTNEGIILVQWKN